MEHDSPHDRDEGRNISREDELPDLEQGTEMPIGGQAQQRHLLLNAPLAQIPKTLYSVGVVRALSAALTLDESTKGLTIIFKSGPRCGLDLLLDNSRILIHEWCLYFDRSHENEVCRLANLAFSHGAETKTFFCYHIIMDLYGLLLSEMRSRMHEATTNYDSLYVKVLSTLIKVPQNIEVKKGNNTGELEVSWADSAGDFAFRLHGLHSKVRITLHKESSCHEKKSELLATRNLGQDLRMHEGEGHLAEWEDPMEAMRRMKTADCGCPEQIAWPPNYRVIFYGLEVLEKYFPMIARVDEQSIFGIPPKSLRPQGREESDSDDGNPRAFSVRPRPSYRKYYSGDDEILRLVYSDIYPSEKGISCPSRPLGTEVEVKALRKELDDKNKHLRELEASVKKLESTQVRNVNMVSQVQNSEVGAAEDERIEQLQFKINRLRDSREKLKQELDEARKDTREAHASTAEALRLIKSLRESGSLVPEASGKLPGGQIRRENTDEVEDRQLSTRASKRVKQEPIDLCD